jgi:predicted transcriptional regulator
MKLAIELSEAQERRLAEIAARLGVPAESLAEAAVRELVDQSSAEFDGWLRTASSTSGFVDPLPQLG